MRHLRRRQPKLIQHLRYGIEQLEDRRVLATLAGQVIDDLNGNRISDPDEPGVSGIHVYDDANGNGELDRNGSFVEPDDFDDSAMISANGMTLSVTDRDNQVIGNLEVWAQSDDFSSSGGKVFGYGNRVEGTIVEDVNFFHELRRLRVDFESTATTVSIDFIGSRPTATESGMLEAFDADGNSLGSVVTADLLNMEVETLSIVADTPSIAYIVAYTRIPEGQRGRLDNLRVDDGGSELWTVTGPSGNYSMDVPAGSYDVDIVVPENLEKTFPGDSVSQTVEQDDVVSEIDFGLGTPVEPTWQNIDNPLDVDANGAVVPRDVVLIINEINQPVFADAATGLLPAVPDNLPDESSRAFFFDVNGDGFVTAVDAVRVINFINGPPPALAAAVAARSDTGNVDRGLVSAALVDHLASNDDELFEQDRINRSRLASI